MTKLAKINKMIPFFIKFLALNNSITVPMISKQMSVCMQEPRSAGCDMLDISLMSLDF